MNRVPLGATTPGLNGPGCNGNKGALRIPQSCSSTGTLPSVCLVSYQGHLFGVGGGLNPLQKCSQCILRHQLNRQNLSVVDNIYKIREYREKIDNNVISNEPPLGLGEMVLVMLNYQRWIFKKYIYVYIHTYTGVSINKMPYIYIYIYSPTPERTRSVCG